MMIKRWPSRIPRPPHRKITIYGWSTSHPGGHHGLDIVRALAKGWGITGNHAARAIWARFDWS